MLDEGSYFFPLSLLDLGTFGVYLFFGLSGCTLYISNHKRIDSVYDIVPFMVKRFFRIWPAFAVSLLVYIVFIEIFRFFYTSNREVWIAQFLNEYTFSDVLRYLSLTFNITGPKDLFIGPYWSLPIEFQYYLLLPFSLLLMKIKGFGVLSPLLFGGVLYFCYREKLFDVESQLVFKMGFVFFGGVLLAKYYQLVERRIPFILSVFVFSLLVLLAGLVKIDAIVVPSYIPLFNDKWNIFGIISLAAVALALLTTPPVNSSKILTFMNSYGTVSYSIYLYHMLFLGVAALLTMKFEFLGGNLGLYFVLAFSLIGSYLFSILSYRYIEKPFVSIGHRLSKIRHADSDLVKYSLRK